ncbi:MAG: PHP domain-containing protein [Candidatus Melainabacteria bacterium]|nr:PHP domain-containing protein [Candidatus Melainabacteria bacterium]
MFDLHVHTHYSDGLATPEALVDAAIEAGVNILAVTDHDTVAAWPALERAAAGTSLRLIPGVEINTVWQPLPDGPRWEVHILGYGIQAEHPRLHHLLNQHQQARHTHFEQLILWLNQTHGLSLCHQELLARLPQSGSPGRPHVARALIELGLVRHMGEAFQRYLSRSKHPGLPQRHSETPQAAVQAITESGGLAVIAHPGEQLEVLSPLIEALIPLGLQGLEVFHKSHPPRQEETLCQLARQWGLLVTGGTDFHGEAQHYASRRCRLHLPDDPLQPFYQQLTKRGLLKNLGPEPQAFQQPQAFAGCFG